MWHLLRAFDMIIFECERMNGVKLHMSPNGLPGKRSEVALASSVGQSHDILGNHMIPLGSHMITHANKSLVHPHNSTESSCTAGDCSYMATNSFTYHTSICRNLSPTCTI